MALGVFKRHTSNGGLRKISVVSMYFGPFLHSKYKTISTSLLMS